MADQTLRNARTEPFDFLGYSFGLHHVKCNDQAVPRRKCIQQGVQRLKTRDQHWLEAAVGCVTDIRDKPNQTLRGREAYFHYGSTRKSYRAVNAHVRTTVRNFLQRRRKVSSRGTRQCRHPVVFGDMGVHELGGSRR